MHIFAFERLQNLAELWLFQDLIYSETYIDVCGYYNISQTSARKRKSRNKVGFSCFVLSELFRPSAYSNKFRMSTFAYGLSHKSIFSVGFACERVYSIPKQCESSSICKTNNFQLFIFINICLTQRWFRI